MIATPPPCVAMESVLCVAAPFGDVLASQFGIIPHRVSSAQHKAAVAALGVEVLDDGADGLIVEPPPSQALKACQGSVCIRYALSCGGGPAPYCAITLHLPNNSRSPRVPPREMLRRGVAIRAQSRQAFSAAVGATYIVVREGEATTLIPMSKLIPIEKALR